MTNPQNDHASVARAALADGQLLHAGAHIALGLDPALHDSEMLALFDEAYDRAANPLVDVYPLGGEMSPGEVAVHARALAKGGSFDDAYRLLSRLGQASPVAFLDWASDWPVPSEAALRDCLGLLVDSGTPTAIHAAYASFVRRAVGDTTTDVLVLAFASGLARRSNDLPGALHFAQRATALGENFIALSALAAASRASGDYEAAFAAWGRAAAAEPDKPYVWLDWGDACIEIKAYDQATERYEQAIARDPQNDWAHGSIAYLHFLRSGTATAWTELRGWSRANPTNQRAAQALRSATPWSGWLPQPTEALFNGWSQMREKLQGANFTLNVIEGPSVLHAIRSNVSDFGCEFEAIQVPDPRTPLFQGVTQLWGWNGTTPQPALPPPSPHLQRHAHELAMQPFEASTWLRGAQERAAGLAAGDALHLLSCVVHPSPPPPDMDALTWFWRVQHSTAFLLAGFPTTAVDAPNIRALDAMLAVRGDWNATAALAALLALAEVNSPVRDHAWARCYQTLQGAPNTGGFQPGDAAYWGLLRMDPGDDAGVARQAVSWIDKS